MRLALLILLAGPAASAAQQTVTGTVVAASTQRPIAGAQVVLEGTQPGTITDNRGRFLIPNAPAGPVTVRVVMIGYRDLVQRSEPDVPLVLELMESAIALDEIIVTGTAGEQAARSIGNAIGKIDVDDLQLKASAPTVQNMISAQVPGVRIMDTGGEIGAGGVMRIRGASSLTLAATPIVVVDGVRVNGLDNESRFVGVGYDPRRGPSRIDDFNPDDIESIEIIKGPAAATLYGTEASNGVIQILTKRGRQGAPRINLTVKQGANWLPDPASLVPPTYYRSSSGEIVEVNVLAADAERGLEWFHNGHSQSYQADVSGGSQTVTYFTSGEWERDNGPVPYNWKSKLSGRANLTFAPSDELKVDFSLGGVRSRTQFASAQQPLLAAVIFSCPAPGCEPGSGLPNALDGPFRGYLVYLPEAFEDEIEGFQDVDRTTFSVATRWEPTGWLAQRLTVGGDFGNNRSSALHRATGNPGNILNFGRRTVLNVRNTLVTADYQASANVTPTDRLGLGTAVGVQFYRRQQESAFGRGERFPVAALETISAGATRIAEEDFHENRTFGVFVQEQVSWDDKLYLTAAVRGDDNSAFGQNFDFVVYPKLSASYVVSEEDFADNPLVNTLKLRAAWGKAGRQPDVFDALRTYEPTVGPEGVATLTPDNIGNPDLEPEVGRELELGFDASLFEDRVGLEFTFYDQRTENAIVAVPAVPSLGFPGVQFQNIAEVSNRGWELGINANVLRADDVRIDLGFTFSTAKNEVVDLGGQPPIAQSAQLRQMHVEGFPLASLFQKRVVSADLVADGTGRNTATNVMCEGGDRVAGTEFSRGGGAPEPCATAPFVYWGQPIPEWEGGASLTVSVFRDLQIFGLVDFLGGRTMISGDMPGQHFGFRNSRAILERTDPILLGYESLGVDGPFQTGTIDAGFAKLRTVSANYTLPTSWADRIGATRLNVTVQADNLATLWVAEAERFGVKQMDPEVVNQNGGVTDGLNAYHQDGWPNLRRFLTTVRVTF